MDTIRDAITQLSQEFKETKEKLAKKDEELAAKITKIYEKECELAEAQRQLAEKNKRLEEMAAKIQKLEEQMENPELHFAAKLNTYKEEMSRGIFSDTFSNFYHDLNGDRKKIVEKTLCPIIFHEDPPLQNVVGYNNFTCFRNGIRLYDSAKHSMDRWEYQNPIIRMPNEMVAIIKNSAVLCYGSCDGQNALIFINRSQSTCTKMRFVNQVGTFSITIENGNVFDDISELKKIFRLRQLADKHNETVSKELLQSHESFLQVMKNTRNLSAEQKQDTTQVKDSTTQVKDSTTQVNDSTTQVNDSTTQVKDDDELSKPQIPKASEVASEVH